MKTLAFCRKNGLVQLNKYETDPNFLQFFQSSTKVCLIIHVFCKSCEPEVVFVLICTLAEQFQVHKSYKTRESTLSWIGNLEENTYLSHIHLAVIQNNANWSNYLGISSGVRSPWCSASSMCQLTTSDRAVKQGRFFNIHLTIKKCLGIHYITWMT
jgi:hypothetical protein